MQIEYAQQQLALARKKVRKLTLQIAELRRVIEKAGGITHHSGIDFYKRNRSIYRRWKLGTSLKELANDVSLSVERTRQICQRIDKLLESKKGDFRKYRSLLKYYDNEKRSQSK